MSQIDVCKIIEHETGQAVTLETPIDDLQVDSLEYIDLLLALGANVDKQYRTVGDIAKDVA